MAVTVFKRRRDLLPLYWQQRLCAASLQAQMGVVVEEMREEFPVTLHDAEEVVDEITMLSREACYWVIDPAREPEAFRTGAFPEFLKKVTVGIFYPTDRKTLRALASEFPGAERRIHTHRLCETCGRPVMTTIQQILSVAERRETDTARPYTCCFACNDKRRKQKQHQHSQSSRSAVSATQLSQQCKMVDAAESVSDSLPDVSAVTTDLDLGLGFGLDFNY